MVACTIPESAIAQFLELWPGIIIPFACTISQGLLCTYLGTRRWNQWRVAAVGALGNGLAFLVAAVLVGWLLKLHGKRVLYDVREDTPASILDTHWIPPRARPAVAWAIDIAEKLSGRILDGIVAATPHIGQRFPLRDAADAHRALEARQTVGSTVLLP